MWMATGRDASQIRAESRWREGIFLGLYGAGQCANDHAVGAPDGVEAARAIKLEPDESAWGLPRDRKRRDSTIGECVPRTPLPAGVLCQQSVEQEEMEGKEACLARDGCTSARTLRSGRTVKLRDVKVVLQSPQSIIDQSLTTAKAGHEWKVQCVATQWEPTVSQNPSDGRMKCRQDLTSSCGNGEAHALLRNTKNG